MSQLELVDVTKSFGGIKAVTHVGFRVPEGSIFGLIGPNGAGKTTVFNLVTGVYRPDSGAIRMNGLDLTTKKPAQIAAAGIARTFQNIRLFSQMSVLDNVLVACETKRRSGYKAKGSLPSDLWRERIGNEWAGILTQHAARR